MNAARMKAVLILVILLVSSIVASHAGDEPPNTLDQQGSDHFIVYYYRVPETFVRACLECAEKCYKDLTDQLGFTRHEYWNLEGRARVYLFPDRESYLRQTRVPAWSDGAAQSDRKTIWTYQQDHGFFDGVLPHETGHIVLREAVGGRAIPLWLEEGVACWLEPTRRADAEPQVRRALRENRFIPLAQLNRITPETLAQRADVALFYAESVSLVSFLVDRYGKSGFHDFCSALRDGKSVDDALSRAYSGLQNAASLAEAWEKRLRYE